ncbi:branched-chain amino acid transaminase [Thalassobacillus pellis]|uniref:branched-chain amino acid transaminase n=1 Tax=Thalassobacillus pellis TaxID=748008 RepID=UPI00195F881C|nr:branched-chain amino acid transaminase [Thalassobacillus pellis]MBM7552092.1 branched-chain amino acid aminotransferase [Thalassobacillus pellis]
MVYMFDNGRFIDERATTVNVKNKGLNYGLGCFEGIRGFWNEEQQQLFVFRLEDHLNRFHHSGRVLFIPIPYRVEELAEIIKQLLIINKVKQDVYIRPICFKGTNTLRPDLNDPFNHLAIYLVFTEYEPKPALRTCISSWTRIGSNMIPPQVKPTAGYLNSALAIHESDMNGFDEAIFLTAEGNVCEGAAENIFIVRGDFVVTPPISDDILPGITRDTAMQIAGKELGMTVVEQSFTRVEVYEADEVFFTGTAVGIKPVVEVDRRQIGDGEPGPVTTRIQRIYDQLVRREISIYESYTFPVYED